MRHYEEQSDVAISTTKYMKQKRSNMKIITKTLFQYFYRARIYSFKYTAYSETSLLRDVSLRST